MGKRSGLAWWLALGWGRRRVAPGADFGDMGTAFGLDASLAGNTDIGPDPRDPRPDTDAPAGSADRPKRRSAT